MNKPKIEIKKFKSFRGRNGFGLNLELWVDGIKAAEVIDSGNGGCYSYSPFDKDALSRVTEYAKELHKDIKFEQLDSLIAELVDKMETEKKFKRLSKKNILWGKPNADTFVKVSFKEELSKMPQYLLQSYFDAYKTKFKEGELFLNTNLKELGVIV